MVLWLTNSETQGAMYIYEKFNERWFEVKKDRWLEERIGPCVSKINGMSEKMMEKLTDVSKAGSVSIAKEEEKL